MGSHFLPFLAMILVQLGYAGMNIISTLAMDSGLNPFVLVAYRQVLATISLVPLAYFLERKTWSKLTFSIVFQIFLLSIFGATLNQMTYFVGLRNSTPTIACAISNLCPAFTFILAVPLRLERVGLRTKAGQAKLLGTTICVGGALLLSFYHGQVLGIGQSSIHLKMAENSGEKNGHSHGNLILGPLLLVISSVSWAVWLILVARVGTIYPAGYSTTALMCFMAAIECGIISFCFDHNLSHWSLFPPIRAVSCIWAGIVCNAIAFCVSSWCIGRKGPLYVSVFSPLLLVIVAILSWAILREKLYVGTLVGSALIVMGLYSVLWGKSQEMQEAESTDIRRNGVEDYNGKEMIKDEEEGLELFKV